MNITITELRGMLLNIRGAKIVTITTKTEPDMPKRNNPYHGILEKISRINGIINFIYSNSVNAQRDREGHPEEFVAQPRKWGTRLFRLDGTITPLVEHNGQFYLEFKVERALGHQYLRRDNGVAVPDEEIRPYLRQHERTSTQGTEKEIILRDYRLSSIVSLTLDGEVYNVVEE